MDFYVNTLKSLVAAGKLDPHAKTLVIAGGPKDRAAHLAAGFTDVTISNLDTRMVGNEFAPYTWALIDGEAIAAEDGAYEQVIEHMGLHHCGSPHFALLEMYRVARSAVLVFENRDSFTMRLAVSLGLVPNYELDAVRGNDFIWGGYRNTSTPNFVYRWTERDVIKTIACADPAHIIEKQFYYNLRFPDGRIAESRGMKRLAYMALRLPFTAFAAIFPRQANEFGFFIDKRSRKLQPWMQEDGVTMKRDYRGRE